MPDPAKFAALILTHGRPDRVYTYDTLRKATQDDAPWLLAQIMDFEAFAGWRPAEVATAILRRLPGTQSGVEALARGDVAAAIPLLLDAATPEGVAMLAAAAAGGGAAAGLTSLRTGAAVTAPAVRTARAMASIITPSSCLPDIAR